jgi:transposase-like protein
MTKTPEGIEVTEGPQPGKRRRFRAEEKRRLVVEASEPGSSVSLVRGATVFRRACCFAGGD